MKTTELTSLEKEGLALHMKVFRLSKALGRPAANWEGQNQQETTIRSSSKALRLPEEIKLKKQLASATKELDRYERANPTQLESLQVKLRNRQNMFPLRGSRAKTVMESQLSINKSLVKSSSQMKKFTPLGDSINKLETVTEIPTHRNILTNVQSSRITLQQDS